MDYILKPQVVEVLSFLVCGLATRTINSDEFNKETARIPALWEEFTAQGVAEKVPGRVPGSPVFGIYSDYDSDASGRYGLTAGVAVRTVGPGYASVRIEEGKYLVFEGSGPMPEAVIQAWATVWEYFKQNPDIRRSFRTDFEAYSGQAEVRIHIGVQS